MRFDHSEITPLYDIIHMQFPKDVCDEIRFINGFHPVTNTLYVMTLETWLFDTKRKQSGVKTWFRTCSKQHKYTSQYKNKLREKIQHLDSLINLLSSRLVEAKKQSPR